VRCGASVSSTDVTFAMIVATIFRTNQRSTRDKFRRFALSSHWIPYAKAVFAISFFVLSAAVVPSRIAPPNAIQPISPRFEWMGLAVIPFRYLTTYVSGCDGRVSIGPGSGQERTPAALVRLGLRSTKFNANIQRSWKQSPLRSCSLAPRQATILTYPVATLKVYSPSLRTWQNGLLKTIGTSTPASTSRDSAPRSRLSQKRSNASQSQS
jgi:hypothetical protein